MDRTLPVSEGGTAQDMTVEEALQLKTYQLALGGSLMARRAILKMIEKREEARAKQASRRGRPVVPVTQLTEEDPDNADEALVLLGIAMPNPDRASFAKDRAQLLLEPGRCRRP